VKSGPEWQLAHCSEAIAVLVHASIGGVVEDLLARENLRGERFVRHGRNLAEQERLRRTGVDQRLDIVSQNRARQETVHEEHGLFKFARIGL
jgi:hypothetical protein